MFVLSFCTLLSLDVFVIIVISAQRIFGFKSNSILYDKFIVSYICLHTTLLFGIVLMCWEKFFVGRSCKCATSQLWSSKVCHLQCVTILQEKKKKKKKERKYFDICFRESCALFCGRVCRLQIQFGGSTIQSDSEKFNFSVKKKRNRKD